MIDSVLIAAWQREHSESAFSTSAPLQCPCPDVGR
jgi:hypothetical protein